LTKRRWAILTGEYPPRPGGVADYTRQVARGLAQAGDEVHVWAPAAGHGPDDPGVQIHGLPDHFGPRSLVILDAELKRRPRPDRILVQYVPHAFGWKALNIPFALWLLSSSYRRKCIWVMFHEVAFPWTSARSLRHNVLGAVTRIMAFLTVRAAEQILVSTPAWERLLKPLAGRSCAIRWLPAPSNMPTESRSHLVAALRKEIAPQPGSLLLGHFGTYGKPETGLLRVVLPPLLLVDGLRFGVLLGRGAEDFARELVWQYPGLGGRLLARPFLSPEQISAHLTACDCLIQPYADGVSTRRTSVMSGLALGLAIVTTQGPLTETIWMESRAVKLVPVSRPLDLVSAANSLLADACARKELGKRAADLYASRFALEHTLTALRS